MQFIDQVRIFVQAGNGGKGCQSFYKDNYTRYPRPDGGDGGKGGDILFIGDHRLQTLLDYRFQQHHKAHMGGHGSSKGKKGKNGEDCILRVPLGTIIRDVDNGLLIKDIVHDRQSVIVAKGGSSGHGNAHGRIHTSPGLGEKRTILLELKLIADVGLIGFPNAGKSTLISSISKVKSKVANYPFTTKQPILGVVEGEKLNFIIADLPGLIEGAHLGRGLGIQFLKHAERTKILVQVIDMAGTEDRDPLDDYKKINNELVAYSEQLSDKQRIIVANKMDLPSSEKNIKRFKRRYSERIIPISALEKKGLKAFIDTVAEKLKEVI